ncbi:MAG: hypothetical protein V2A61_00355 [Calditrichota bacterium]
MKHLIPILFTVILALGVLVKASAQVEFVVPMRGGWNMISAPVIPVDPRTEVMFREIVRRDNLIILKDGDGRYYLPRWEFINLPPWDFRKGYQVKLANDDTQTITGELVDPETPIPLRRGWNIVAFFPEQRLQAWNAFFNIRRQLIIAKDVKGHFFYYSLEMLVLLMERGQGYQVKVSENVELVWLQE